MLTVCKRAGMRAFPEPGILRYNIIPVGVLLYDYILEDCGTESTARLSVSSVDQPVVEVDWAKCIICQQNRFPKKKFPLTKGSATGIAT